jgi:hypothetical protein
MRLFVHSYFIISFLSISLKVLLYTSIISYWHGHDDEDHDEVFLPFSLLNLSYITISLYSHYAHSCPTLHPNTYAQATSRLSHLPFVSSKGFPLLTVLYPWFYAVPTLRIKSSCCTKLKLSSRLQGTPGSDCWPCDELQSIIRNDEKNSYEAKTHGNNCFYNKSR